MAGRLIFHCDGNNFFASCECIEHPEWRDVPMAVAGDPKDRCGIVVAKNELAKKAGVKTTDTIWQARQKCPNILFVPPHHDEYARVSRRMNAIFREYTDFVEPASIDESYLDMTGAPGSTRKNSQFPLILISIHNSISATRDISEPSARARYIF